ncbi:MAG: hypothetical protein AAGA48_11910 [Myxococcota bacterium]
MQRHWLGMMGLAVMGCGDPFPPIDNTITLDDTSPDETGTTIPIDTTPTAETGKPTVPKTTPEPQPDDVEFTIQLERIELLTQNCDGGTNGPAAEIYYDLRVGNQFGWQLVVARDASDNIDMLPIGDPEAMPLELNADPVTLRINEDGQDQLIIFGQIYDRDVTSDNDLIANYDDLIWMFPADVPLGTTAFTRAGPSQNPPEDQCEASLFVTIERVKPKPNP